MEDLFYEGIVNSISETHVSIKNGEEEINWSNDKDSFLNELHILDGVRVRIFSVENKETNFIPKTRESVCAHSIVSFNFEETGEEVSFDVMSTNVTLINFLKKAKFIKITRA